VTPTQGARPQPLASRPSAGAGLRGDEADLFHSRHRAVLRHVRRAAPGAAEAVVEDACLFAWLALLRRQPERDHVRGWLCVVARREARRQHARARRVLSLDVAARVEGQDGDHDEAGPLVERIAGRETVEDAHAAREALRALAGLPETQRRYLALKVAGFGYREICALTGASYTNVNKHLARARARVREATMAA
jgi:RNA polymerase sigma factor (sigma-70 family)